MVDQAVAQAVRIRANHRCEYCQMPQSAYRERFHIDHIIARQHGGGEDVTNLALSCLRCNRYKGPNLSGIDPQSGLLTGLYNPRIQSWSDHFVWHDAVLMGTTPTGRATIAVLAINHPDRMLVRRSLIDEGTFFVESDG